MVFFGRDAESASVLMFQPELTTNITDILVPTLTVSQAPADDLLAHPFLLHLVSTATASVLGIVLNGYILIVLIWNKHFQTANNLLLLHLAFVDTLFCVVVLGTNIAFWALPSTTDELSSACQAHGAVWTSLPVVMVWTLCGLSCDRYAAISTPLHYSRLVNTRRASVFLIVSWMLGVSLAIPPLARICSYVYQPARCACISHCPGTSPVELGYAFTYVWVVIVFPVTIILICNLHVLTIARYHRHRIVAAIYEVTLRAQATVTHQRNPWYLSKFKGRNAVFTIIQLFGSLALLTAPYFGVLSWEAATGKRIHEVVASVTTVLLCWTPSVNAYVYGVKSRVLRQTFKNLLRRHFYKQEVTREVDRRLSMCAAVAPGGKPKLIRRFSAPDMVGNTTKKQGKGFLPRRASEKCMVLTGLRTPPTRMALSTRRSALRLDGQPSRVSVFPLILENGLSEDEQFGNNNNDDEDDDSRSPSRHTPDSTITRPFTV
ncbi:ultraviolet-sensitive opsin-like isoform X2 [Ornithodoros turicata]|uniref:ultraviolet-sensitive opsin-like isoform X2 n=1 Tax=Ornithodoros turicata TaxID=34597 RepID=UPI00313866A8